MEQIVFIVGPRGAGKTTAVATASIGPIVSTDAFDYGQFGLPEGKRIGLYAPHAREARGHGIWNAIGVIALLDAGAADAGDRLARYASQYSAHVGDHTFVVGLTQTDTLSGTEQSLRIDQLQCAFPSIPTLVVDVRDKVQITILLGMLMDRVDSKKTRELAD